VAATEKLLVSARVERIGLADSHLSIADAQGATLLDRPGGLRDHAAAVEALLTWLSEQKLDRDLTAVGHRVVYGGVTYRTPQTITAKLLASLDELVSLDPDHLPPALDAIRVASRAYPTIPQVACFDTAFHRTLPRVAQLYGLPRALAAQGVIRFGFHGLSYEYIVQALRKLDRAAAKGRLIIAHLGNGASLAAVRGGLSVDTTMGFTPTGGLVMGTRSGDLDPGVLLYLLQVRRLSPEAVSTLVNRQAGLLGVSGLSGDMQDLLSQEATNPQAAEAIALFCYQARKFLGALATTLGGLDTLVFTAGIGENAAPVRQRICAGLEFLGIQLAAERNAAHAPIISRDDSPVVVRVMHTDEDVMIARQTHRLVAKGEASHVSI
jgi:acetate kinase